MHFEQMNSQKLDDNFQYVNAYDVINSSFPFRLKYPGHEIIMELNTYKDDVTGHCDMKEAMSVC